jgi:TonB family protein
MPSITKIAVFALFLGLNCCPSLAQQQSSQSERKVISRVVPSYPELARKMNLEGIVKLEVTVAPNGNARNIEALGGSPLLVKAAQDALLKWKWAPASETKELIELNFHPQ